MYVTTGDNILCSFLLLIMLPDDRRPIKTLQDTAFEAVREAEAGREINYKRFLRGVSNDMAFYNFPESWRPML